MKKLMIIAMISTFLFLTPSSNALSIFTKDSLEQKTLTILPVNGYNGTFIGGFGRIYKDKEEWQFEYKGYLGGIYKNQDKYRILYGNIYNLEQEKIGTITMFSAKSLLIGKIENNEGTSVPITGFFITKDDNYFVGRIMSFFGPAHHIWGKFTPD